MKMSRKLVDDSRSLLSSRADAVNEVFRVGSFAIGAQNSSSQPPCRSPAGKAEPKHTPPNQWGKSLPNQVPGPGTSSSPHL